MPHSVKMTDRQILITSWKYNLDLRVRASEITQDTASAYGRGTMKFMTWLGDKQVSADVIREWKADLLTACTRPSSINAWAQIQKVKGTSCHSSLDTLMIYYHEVDRLTEPAEKFISYTEQ